jgi:hypothetical protein
LNEDTPSIREFHNSSLIASEQVKSVLGFEVGNLFAERRLGYMQSIRGPPEVQLFGQGNDCKQVTYFNAGEHAHTSSGRRTEPLLTLVNALHLVKEPEGKKKYQKKLLDSARFECSEPLTAAGSGWHASRHLAI